jgi:uncharacterized protein
MNSEYERISNDLAKKGRIKVKVIPGASRNEIISWDGERLSIRLKAHPEKGKANEQLITFLKKVLNIRTMIEKGTRSREKVVRIEA